MGVHDAPYKLQPKGCLRSHQLKQHSLWTSLLHTLKSSGNGYLPLTAVGWPRSCLLCSSLKPRGYCLPSLPLAYLPSKEAQHQCWQMWFLPAPSSPRGLQQVSILPEPWRPHHSLLSSPSALGRLQPFSILPLAWSFRNANLIVPPRVLSVSRIQTSPAVFEERLKP